VPGFVLAIANHSRSLVREKASNRVVYVDERAGRRDVELIESDLAELDEQQFGQRWDRLE
jgi:hypothetical protein